jgi:four helix bundle protein
MQNPDKLRISKQAEELALAVYAYTDELPQAERYGLISQMRRAAVSIGSNIFEGCSRQTNKSFMAYLYRAHGSAGEILFQLRVAVRMSYGDAAKADAVRRGLINIRRGLAHFIKALRDQGSS